MLGFIGLGTMGNPMCRNLAAKSKQEVRAFDSDVDALSQMDEPGVTPAESVREVAERADIIFLSLPGGPQVQSVCLGGASLLTYLKPGGCVVDLSTTPANLACMASEVTLCGGPGTGQAMKLINNLVLFQTVVALAEALSLAGHAGLDPELAFEVLSKGSADSFALRHHGMKAMLKGDYPERAYSCEYALKDIRYALRLGEEAGLFLNGADNAKEMLKRAIRAGYAKEYFPALAKVITGTGAGTGTGKGAGKKKGG